LKYNLQTGQARNADGKTITYTLTSDARDIASIEYQDVPKAQSYGYNEYGQVIHEETPGGQVTDYIPNSVSGFKDKEIRSGVQPYIFGYDGSIAAYKTLYNQGVGKTVTEAVEFEKQSRFVIEDSNERIEKFR
jgi:YD repeat-containing protein